jgi:PAS domain-containing protein
LGYIAGILFLDHLLSMATITPLFASIGLLMMAFYLRPKAMYCWAISYCVIVALVLLHPGIARMMHDVISPQGNRVTPLLRLGHEICTATLASFTCYYLNKLQILLGEERDIVSGLPVPVITSDFNGNIRYANDHAVKLLGLKSCAPSGVSYFDLLAPKRMHGEFIAEYFRRMDGQLGKSPFILEHEGISMIGNTQLLASKTPKLMLTILGAPNGGPTPPNVPSH